MGIPGCCKERQEQVLLDPGKGRPAQPDGTHYVHGIVTDEDHVAGLFRHVGATANGDADIGGGQGRGVVDPVPHHPTLSPLA